jgi:hypothetical protein
MPLQRYQTAVQAATEQLCCAPHSGTQPHNSAPDSGTDDPCCFSPVQVKDGAFLSPDAWQALGGTASALLSAGTTLTYIGPVFALFGYAIKQWSTCQEVPQEAVNLLQSCRDLLFDLNQAWSHIMPKQQQQQQERLQHWLRLVAEAAAECVVINSKGPIMR